MNAIRTNLKLERNAIVKGILLWVPAIQNGYMAAPRILQTIDFKAFIKTQEEKDLLLTFKERSKADRKKEFGAAYKRHLNTSNNKIVPSMKFSF